MDHGKRMLEDGDFEGAEQYYNSVLKRYPDDRDALLGLVLVTARISDLQKLRDRSSYPPVEYQEAIYASIDSAIVSSSGPEDRRFFGKVNDLFSLVFKCISNNAEEAALTEEREAFRRDRKNVEIYRSKRYSREKNFPRVRFKGWLNVFKLMLIAVGIILTALAGHYEKDTMSIVLFAFFVLVLLLIAVIVHILVTDYPDDITTEEVEEELEQSINEHSVQIERYEKKIIRLCDDLAGETLG